MVSACYVVSCYAFLYFSFLCLIFAMTSGYDLLLGLIQQKMTAWKDYDQMLEVQGWLLSGCVSLLLLFFIIYGYYIELVNGCQTGYVCKLHLNLFNQFVGIK